MTCQAQRPGQRGRKGEPLRPTGDRKSTACDLVDELHIGAGRAERHLGLSRELARRPFHGIPDRGHRDGGGQHDLRATADGCKRWNLDQVRLARRRARPKPPHGAECARDEENDNQRADNKLAPVPLHIVPSWLAVSGPKFR